MKLSACLVIRNEEKLLGRCLESLKKVVDEIIIVHDGKCTDSSLEIAKSYNAKIFVRNYVGEAEFHRPFTYQKAKGDWIIQIDADEFLSNELVENLPELLRSGNCDAYHFSWPYPSANRYISIGPFARTYKPALFRKEKLYMIGVSHEYPRTYGKACTSDLLIEHKPLYDNFTLAVFKSKWKKWAKIQASQLKILDSMPVFNIKDRNGNQAYLQLKHILKHPLQSGIKEIIKFTLIYFSRGLLFAGLISWKIAIMEIIYIWLLRFYLIKK